MDDTQSKLWDMLSQQEGKTVLNLFMQYYGGQLLDEGFEEHCIKEGYLDEEEEEDE